MKKRIKFSWISISLLILSVLFWGCTKAVETMKKRDIIIYYLGVDTYNILDFLNIAFTVALTLAIIVLLFQNVKKIVIPIIISSVMVLVVSFYTYLSLNLFFEPESKYYEFVSDDKEHTIIIRESSWLLSGGGTIYQKTSPYTLTPLGGYTTDDGLRPIRQNQYYFDWYDGWFEFHYNYNDEIYKSVDCEYVK